MTFPKPRRIRLALLSMTKDMQSQAAMMIEMRTKLRWIVSVLEAVAEGSDDDRIASRTSTRQSPARKLNPAWPKGLCDAA